MQKRPLVLLILALLAFISGCATDESVYEIGVSAPFSGQEGAAVYGTNIKNAVELAVDEVNALGGVRGRQIRVKYEDDQLLPSTAVAAVSKLASVDKVKVIIGPVASSSTIAASKIANDNKVILISPASTSHEISGISPYVFRTIAPDVFEGEAMASYALSKGYRRFGVAFVDNAGTKSPAEVFRKKIEAAGAEIAEYEVVPQGSTDVRMQVTKLAAAKPEAVYLLGYALELGTMIKQFREQDKTTPILSFQVMEEPKVREIAGDAAEGVVFTTPTHDEESATGQERSFIEAYRRRYSVSPGIFAANAYDAVKVLAKVIQERGFEVDSIRTGLLSVRAYPGASGVFDINDKGDSNQLPRIMVIRSGSIVPIEQ